MSATVATDYVRQMVQEESRGSGDIENAMARIARKNGLTKSQLEHFRRGRAKTCDINLFQKIRLAYLDHCERQIEKFKRQHQEAQDDHTQDLLAQAESLLGQINAAKAKTKTKG